VGLDYQALFKVAQILEIDMSPCMFSKIRALERAALKEQKEKIEKERHHG